MNQKGFIAIPVLVWWLVGATVLVGGITAVKSGYVAINLQEEVECPEGTVKTQFGNNFECLTKQAPTLGSVLPTKIEPSPTPTPTKKPVQQVVPNVDPDPIINCNFTYLGSKKLRRSECSKSFDCQIGGQWYIYTDKNKCSEDQKNYWSKVYSPPATGNSNTIPSTQPSKPLVDCVLSYGTYRWLESDCENAKRRDEEDQKRQEELNIQSAVNQLEKQVLQYQQEEQRKTDLEACLKKANDDKNNALEVEKKRQESISGAGLVPSDLITKQILQNWAAMERTCHANYGY